MMNVKVFSDYACPFCYLGLGLLEKLKEDGVEYNLEWIPFELDQNAPLEGMNLFTVYSKEYVLKSLDLLQKLGADYGIEYNNKNSKFNTRRAHLGGFYAKTNNKYEEYGKALFKAYFTDKINIGNRDELDKIAESIGLNVIEMNDAIDSGRYEQMLKDAYKEAEKYKVQSVPSFIINEKTKVAGVRDYPRFKEDFLAATELK